MDEPYLGEIRLFAGNFAPVGWMFCAGQQLPIPANQALFSVIGTSYGGDGFVTFALPDFRGRIPVHMGEGRTLAEASGVESVTLASPQTPRHSHTLQASLTPAQNPQPQNSLLAQSATLQPYINDVGQVSLSSDAVATVGGGEPHENMQPYLCISFIICVLGAVPRPN